MQTALFQPTSPSPPAVQQGSIDVLILDDVRFDRHRLSRLCSTLDVACEVRSASTLDTFNLFLHQHSFDLILIDYSLPDGSGLDALQHVYLCPRNLNAATLLISDDAPQAVQQQAETLGCNGYLSKNGLNADTFARAVAGALAPAAQKLPAPALYYTAEQVQHLLSLGTTRCVQDIKPTISRMMRQMRELRARKNPTDMAGLHAIEQNCLSLWIFLVEMQREGGQALLSELQNPSETKPTTAKPRSRPPSPFGTKRG